MEMSVKYPTLNASEVFRVLPPEYPFDLTSRISEQRTRLNQTIVVLDDDPTGTQTVHGVAVITEWTTEHIKKEFEAGTDIFYILTNSRSMPAGEANMLAKEIGTSLRLASKQTGRNFLVISRSDSTLRGHYPNEVEAIAKSINYEDAITFLVPAFFEGGRYTINDVHYIKEKNQLIPVSETPFAADKTFGFRHSNLKRYVEEKSGGKIPAVEVQALSINDLRTQQPEDVVRKINAMPTGAVCVVNAASYRDLQVFALAMLLSERKVLLRSAASIVPVLAGIDKIPLLVSEYFQQSGKNGILVIVGFYVPKTSAQLENLKKTSAIHLMEIEVNQVVAGKLFSQEVARQIDNLILAGEDVVVYTSRTLVADADPVKSLLIGKKVSEFITAVVSALKVQPKCILAKGGITSSDIATKGLGVKKAMVTGQVAAGVPVWKLGEEAKFPDLNYIVFPGNVGDDATLKDVFMIVRGDREKK